MARAQVCDGCKSAVRHGFPMGLKLFCTLDCFNRHWRPKGR